MSSWTFLKTSLDAKNIEFQRVHRLGKPKNDSGDGGRTIIARFLRGFRTRSEYSNKGAEYGAEIRSKI